jgi:hypothetical protein
MGFVQRAFTPPGTGDMSAVVAQQTAAAEATKALQAAKAQPAPTPPTLPAGPEAPKQFAAGQAAQAARRSQVSASTMLGAAATGGQTTKKSVLGA